MSKGPRATETVREHCRAAVSAASLRLERAWCDILQEMARTEFDPRLAAAIRARNVFDLIDAAVEFERSGLAAASKIKELAFEASVAEEAWLTWKSIHDAALNGDSDEIELWAEQARLVGEDVAVELAYASMLREQASRRGSVAKSGSGTEDGPQQAGGDDELANVFGDSKSAYHPF